MESQSNSTSFESSSLSAYWTPRTGYYLTILTVLLSVWLFLRSKPESSKLCVPFYKTSKLKWIFDAESQIVKSYKQVSLHNHLNCLKPCRLTYLSIQFQDQVYQIKATEGTQAIIPPKFIAEIKGLPEDTLSATEAVADVGCHVSPLQLPNSNRQMDRLFKPSTPILRRDTMVICYHFL